ncbi:MAG: hypothetical protein WBX25_30955 [Rhodomicrobium sp.]
MTNLRLIACAAIVASLTMIAGTQGSNAGAGPTGAASAKGAVTGAFRQIQWRHGWYGGWRGPGWRPGWRWRRGWGWGPRPLLAAPYYYAPYSYAPYYYRPYAYYDRPCCGGPYYEPAPPPPAPLLK